MKLSSSLLVALLATEAMGTWASNAAYNKWDATELDRWLADHNIPHPTPADRKDLERLVAENWNQVVSPYHDWDAEKLQTFLESKGQEVGQDTKASKDTLIDRVKAAWYETEDNAQQAWTNVKEWIFDTWSDSQLKAFCDKHDIPVPQPRPRDVTLEKIRSHYDTVARKAGETAAYPGDWLYETWSASDLKKWLDEHGISRDELIAAVRRNSRLVYLKLRDAASTASEAAKSAFSDLSDSILDTWSESQLKEFLDENGIAVPQGTKTNELRALIRKHRAQVLGEDAAGKLGAATSSAGNEFAKATDSAALKLQDAFNKATELWSHSRLKAFLDARGIGIPQGSNTDEVRDLVRKHAHSAIGGWTFDDWSLENLKKYLLSSGDAKAQAAAEKATATRNDLLTAAQSAYSSASSAGGDKWSSATSYLAQATADAKHRTFETWSESELKSYLDSYGVSVPQGSKPDDLRAEARKQFTYFKYGTSSPGGTILEQLSENFWSAWDWATKQFEKAIEGAEKRVQGLRQEL
ncbi:hypothetical protein SAPIO_CDS0015 [Scedosporium apiospermum]|uniref:Uncharacterized protein n=1 Tax=Pseudallescheria apiosperma TaxID=563466 RepID=A0A084GHC7_PSEDA|nr:uncharacterized protein SAPIO_CDS0015 [Scedosporium apiospermum]KEZ46739.1 hypothetical protein SAPIO_CDS0015 [Scedosporium apiospermum]